MMSSSTPLPSTMAYVSSHPLLHWRSWRWTLMSLVALWGPVTQATCCPQQFFKNPTTGQPATHHPACRLMPVSANATQFVLDVWKSLYPNNPSELALQPASQRFAILKARYQEQCTTPLSNQPTKCRVCPFTLSDVYRADFATDNAIEQISSVDESAIEPDLP